jgi:hypothetical protein
MSVDFKEYLYHPRNEMLYKRSRETVPPNTLIKCPASAVGLPLNTLLLISAAFSRDFSDPLARRLAFRSLRTLAIWSNGTAPAQRPPRQPPSCEANFVINARRNNAQELNSPNIFNNMVATLGST